MKNFKSFLLVSLLLLGISSCKEDKVSPEGTSSGAPGAITNAVVTNLNGGAKVTYTLPNNRDLLYVKAVFNRNGKEVDVKSSLYNNFIMLEGFGDTNSHEVKLYAVNRFEEESAPVSVTVKPLEPPVISIYKTLIPSADFSGLNFAFQNATESEVSIHVLAKDKDGLWVPAQEISGGPSVLYTKRKNGVFAVRGFAPVKRQFALYVKDRWGNVSDTLKTELTPLAEIELDRTCPTCFKKPAGVIYVAKDGEVAPVGGWEIDRMFNNQFNDPTFHTNTGSGMPQWVTFSVGPNKTFISRFKLWPRGGGAFAGPTPRKFELWGSETFTNDFGPNWILLGTFESIRPSGLPVGVANTAEDNAQATNGEEFVLPPNGPAIKFLRFKTNETWGRERYAVINELRFWGNPM